MRARKRERKEKRLLCDGADDNHPHDHLRDLQDGDRGGNQRDDLDINRHQKIIEVHDGVHDCGRV